MLPRLGTNFKYKMQNICISEIDLLLCAFFIKLYDSEVDMMSVCNSSYEPHLHHRLRPAFTLVELLVVMSIIALLVAMLLPALIRAREAAKRVQCASNLRNNGAALLMYAQDNRGAFPLANFAVATLMRTHVGGTDGWDPTVDVDALFKRYGINFKTLTCPSGSWRSSLFVGVGPLTINYFYNGGSADWTSTPPAIVPWYGYHYYWENLYTQPPSARPVPTLSMAKPPGDCALMTDVYRPNGAQYAAGIYVYYSSLNGVAESTYPFMPASHPQRGLGSDGGVVAAGANILYCDMSVQWKHPNDLKYRYTRFFQVMYW